jgi:peroxiredoxin Q/BCP
VVLYFYPSDGSETCTAEACEFRDHWGAVRRAGALLFGISPDGARSHARFRARLALPFPLLVDADHAVARRYGAWGRKVLFGRRYTGLLRTTVVIGPDGRVARVFERVRVRGHAAAVLEAVRALPAAR